MIQQQQQQHTQAFWNSLCDDLRLDTPCFIRVIRVLSEIRSGICESCNRASVHDAAAAAIDIDFIQTQIDAGAYGWDNCKRLVVAVVGIVEQIQSPTRVSRTRTQWTVLQKSMQRVEEEKEITTTASDKSVVLCEALEFLLGLISALRIDSANSRWGLYFFFSVVVVVVEGF